MPDIILMAYDYRTLDMETLKLILHPADNRPVTLVYGTGVPGHVLAQADTYTWSHGQVSHQTLAAEQAVDLWLDITAPKLAARRPRILRRLLMLI